MSTVNDESMETQVEAALARHHTRSLRDWFAGQALTGILAQGPHDASVKEHALDAYRFADAMLAARSARHD